MTYYGHLYHLISFLSWFSAFWVKKLLFNKKLWHFSNSLLLWFQWTQVQSTCRQCISIAQEGNFHDWVHFWWKTWFFTWKIKHFISSSIIWFQWFPLHMLLFMGFSVNWWDIFLSMFHFWVTKLAFVRKILGIVSSFLCIDFHQIAMYTGVILNQSASAIWHGICHVWVSFRWKIAFLPNVKSCQLVRLKLSAPGGNLGP